MNPRIICLLLSFALLCIGATILVTRAFQPKAASRVPAQLAETQVNQRVDNIEAELGAQRALLARWRPQPQTVGNALPTSAEPQDAVALPSTPTRARLSAQERDRLLAETSITTFDATLNSEPRDVGWERKTQRSLAQTLSQAELAESHLRDVTCTQSLCKIVFQHQDSAARDKFMDAETQWLGVFAGEQFMHYSRATNETTLYAAPDGQHLPAFDLPAG